MHNYKGRWSLVIHRLANHITYIFVLHGESSEEDRDIYTYAIEAVLALLFNLAICLIIAFLFGRIFEGFVFITAFAFLRRFTGGYHADSHYKCILTFSTLLTCKMLVVSFLVGLHTSIFITLTIAIFAWIGIFIFAPIDDENRAYEGDSKTRLKKKSVAVSTLLLLICVTTGFLLNTYIAMTLSLAMLSVFGCMLFAIIRRHSEQKLEK